MFYEAEGPHDLNKGQPKKEPESLDLFVFSRGSPMRNPFQWAIRQKEVTISISQNQTKIRCFYIFSNRQCLCFYHFGLFHPIIPIKVLRCGDFFGWFISPEGSRDTNACIMLDPQIHTSCKYIPNDERIHCFSTPLGESCCTLR